MKNKKGMETSTIITLLILLFFLAVMIFIPFGGKSFLARAGDFAKNLLQYGASSGGTGIA